MNADGEGVGVLFVRNLSALLSATLTVNQSQNAKTLYAIRGCSDEGSGRNRSQPKTSSANHPATTAGDRLRPTHVKSRVVTSFFDIGILDGL